MKPKNYEVLMDIYMGVLNAPAIQFTTEDFGMCQITFSLLEDRITPYNLSNCIVRMVINGQQQDCTISDANNGKAEIVLLQSMFTEVGHVFAELQIYDATNQTMRLTTPTFKYTVRKSLMDDNTVQADANYSILQQMILNVSNADKVSSEALKIANNAKAICDDLVPKANTAAQNAQTALDRAESVVTQEELAQKVMLGGTAQTKFDFIKNKVVQDGLKYLSKINTTTVKSGINIQNDTDDFDIMIIVDQITYVTSSTKTIVMSQNTNSAKMDMRFQLTGGNYRVGVWISGINDIPVLQQVERPRYIGFKRKNGVYYSYTDTQVLKLGKTAESISFTSVVFGSGSTENKGFIVPIAYNRELSQEEKQYNLSDFNNLPAIKELHTTNAEGETSILKLASDEDHVEMASGRTLREEYMGVLKTMGKEFVGSDGSPIEVNNGIKARVINAEIKGNTQLFKRAKGSQDEWAAIQNDEARDTVAFEYKLDSTQAIISNNGESYPIYANEEDKANKKVISLGGVGDVKDTLEILEDGSAIWMQNVYKSFIDASLVTMQAQNETHITCTQKNDGVHIPKIAWALNDGICNRLKWLGNYLNNENCIGVNTNKNFSFTFLKSDFATLDAVKESIISNPIELCYQLDTPIVTHIPKEIVPSILTHKTNILDVGGAVKPSSFKVTVPVDKLAEIEARLQALESTTVDVVLNK